MGSVFSSFDVSRSNDHNPANPRFGSFGLAETRMSDKSQRTEKPTQRRLQKAREDGQFAVSREFIGSLQFVVFLALLISNSPAALRGLQEIFRRLVLAAFAQTLSVSDLWHTALTLSVHFGKTIAFAGLGIVASTLLFQLLQTRFGLSAKRLQPDWKRLNPAKKAQQLYTQNLPEFAKALVLLPMFCWLIYQIAASEIDVLSEVASCDFGTGAPDNRAFLENALVARRRPVPGSRARGLCTHAV